MQLRETLPNLLHGQASKHPVVSKMMQEMTQKYYLPTIANHLRKWVKECQN